VCRLAATPAAGGVSSRALVSIRSSPATVPQTQSWVFAPLIPWRVPPSVSMSSWLPQTKPARCKLHSVFTAYSECRKISTHFGSFTGPI
jgi:hypothetical protein